MIMGIADCRQRIGLALLGGGLLLSGCLPLPGGYSLSRKPVAAKEGSAVLVADDGTRCGVPPRTFAEVTIGDEHRCAWNESESSIRTPGTLPSPRFPRR
jgi:hypothetical protein